METKFNLVLINQAKAARLGWLWVGCATGAGVGLYYTVRYGNEKMFIALLLVGAVTVLTLSYFLNRTTRQPTLITITAERLSILNRLDGQEQHLLFQDMVKCFWWRGRNAGLVLKLKNRCQVLLKSHEQEQFGIMANRLEAAMRSYQKQLLDGPFKSVWVSPFWGNSLSTIILVLFTAFVLSVIWSIGTPADTRHGSIYFFELIIVMLFASYAKEWYSTRRQRR